jgi:AcrR family transcriptional regulator
LMRAIDELQSLREKRPYHHGDLRAALVAAALLLIDQRGVKGFTLKDAVRIAGVSTAAPYRHFADKEALLRSIQKEGFVLFNAALADAYEKGVTPRAKVLELGVAYVRFALEHSAHFRVMFGIGGGEMTGPLGTNANGFLLLVAAVAALHPDAPGEVKNGLVLACWSVVHGFALLQMDGAIAATVGVHDPEEQLRRILDLMIATGSHES